MSQRRRPLLPSLRPSSHASSFPSTANTTSSLAIPSSSTFPRSGHKLSRVLSPRSASSPTSIPESEPFTYDAWSTMDHRPEPETDLDRITQPVMTRLLSDTLHGLPASFNPLLMRIIESHTTLRLENKRLHAQIDDSHQVNRDLSSQHRQDASHWLLRELEYEKIIKTLHTRLDHHLQLFSDATSSHPMVDCRHPQLSASSVHRGDDKPLEGFDRESSSQPDVAPANPKTSKKKVPSPLYTPCTRGHETADAEKSSQGRPSNDSLSTFSGADTLSDDDSASPDVTIDQDFASIRRLAEVMARRRDLSLERALTQLTDTFYGEDPTTPVTAVRATSSPQCAVDTCQMPVRSPFSTKSRGPQSQSLIARQHAHAREDGRTFSFNPGDDSSFASQMLDTLKSKENTSNLASSPRSIGSPSSLHNLSKVEDFASPTRSGAPSTRGEKFLPASPTVRSPGTGSVKSRIPSPAYNSWSAVSRDRRGKSSSSVTTAIKSSTPLEASDADFVGYQNLEKRDTGSNSK